MSGLTKTLAALAVLAWAATLAIGYAAIWTGGSQGDNLADSTFLTFTVALALSFGMIASASHDDE